MRAGTQVVVALLVAGVLASCRQVVGIGDPQAPPTCSRPASTEPACNQCVAERCCAELEACDGSPACRPLVDCLGRCGDDACRDQCEARTKPSQAAVALLACQSGACDAACTEGCGGAGAPFTGCQACGAACCADGRAFRASIDGRRLRACRAACAPDDIGCKEECTSSHAIGADLERAGRECVVRACAVPGDWSCVGRVERSRASARTTIVWNLRVIDSRTLAPLAGVTARGCNADDLTCDGAPWGVVTTYASGVAGFTIALDPLNGHDAYAGFIELSRPDYVPELVYLFPGSSTGTATLVVPMTSTAFFRQVEARSGTALAADRGVVAVTTLDCTGTLRGGVSLHEATPSVDAHTFYLGSASASETAYDFTATSTAEPGVAGIFNLPAGTQRLTRRVDDLCLDLGSIDVGIRPGTITFAISYPLR